VNPKWRPPTQVSEGLVFAWFAHRQHAGGVRKRKSTLQSARQAARLTSGPTNLFYRTSLVAKDG
jgi:hypothetical protein